MPERRNWKRLALEVVVIVGSILLAFGIEAWWDARGEAREEALVLQAIRSEMEATLERIDAHRARRAVVSEALVTFLESSPAALAVLDPDSAASFLRARQHRPHARPAGCAGRLRWGWMPGSG